MLLPDAQGNTQDNGQAQAADKADLAVCVNSQRRRDQVAGAEEKRKDAPSQFPRSGIISHGIKHDSP
jgi:hypothetical protein